MTSRIAKTMAVHILAANVKEDPSKSITFDLLSTLIARCNVPPDEVPHWIEEARAGAQLLDSLTIVQIDAAASEAMQMLDKEAVKEYLQRYYAGHT